MARAAASTSITIVFALGLVGLTNTATRTAPGTRSRRSSSRFSVISTLRKLTPVRLPPGRARVVTRLGLPAPVMAITKFRIWVPLVTRITVAARELRQGTGTSDGEHHGQDQRHFEVRHRPNGTLADRELDAVVQSARPMSPPLKIGSRMNSATPLVASTAAST